MFSAGSKSRTCEVCGDVDYQPIPAPDHLMKPAYEFQTPDCTHKGLMRQECSRCDYIKSWYLDALGHKFGGWTEIAATCTTSGEKSRICERCGVVERIILYPLGHQFGAWVQKLAPTCTTTGTTERTCGRCGQVETGVLYALGHAMQPFVVTLTPTCTAEGKRCPPAPGETIRSKKKSRNCPTSLGFGTRSPLPHAW